MSANPEDAPVAGTWKVTTADADARTRLTELVMAWGKDELTGEPRYVFELSPNRRGAKCGCVCYSCGLPLTAVNAARADWQVRPHFRHPDGAERNTCLVLTARATALAMLQREDKVVLPARRVEAQVVGLSGKKYDAWTVRPPERVSIKSFKPRDQVSAVLTLEDGREVLVKLTGTLKDSSEGESLPVIELEVDDPALASLDPEMLKARLHLLVETGSWCGMHWDDEAMALESHRQAKAKAFETLDWLPPEAAIELEGASSRESLLHWLTKDILRQEGQLQVPAVVFQEFYGGVPPSGSRELARRPASLLQLSNTRLEKKVGQIRPDVVTDYLDPLDGTSGSLIVEVTVTNEILPERLVRIQREGQAALEINIGHLGGQLTRQDFVRLVIEELAVKRWLHHPWLVDKASHRKAELEEEERAAQLEVARLKVLYLEAVKRFAELREQDPETPDARQERVDAKERIRSIGAEFALWGVENAEDPELYGWQGCILDRLLSIQGNRAVGYKLTTLWEVLHTATLEKAPEKLGWHTLHLIALKTYAPPLEPRHQPHIERWRLKVIGDLVECASRGRVSVYRRSRKFDPLLGLLFPEMDRALRRALPGDLSKDSPTGTVVAKGRGGTGVGVDFSVRRNPDLWLKGNELEDWRMRHPEAALAWEQGRRGR